MSRIYYSDFSPAEWGPSCICTGQSLATPTGWIEVDDARRKFVAGRRVDLLVDGVAAPVVGAMLTCSRSREIRLADGRSVRLTGSHALPSGEDVVQRWNGVMCRSVGMRYVNTPRPAHPKHERGLTPTTVIEDGGYQVPGAWIPTLRLANGHPVPGDGRIIDDHNWVVGAPHPEWDARFKPIAPGDEIDGSTVAEVLDLGVVESVRLVTSRMGWLQLRTPAGSIRVGQRWHEMPDVFFGQEGELIFTSRIWSLDMETLALQGSRARESDPLHTGVFRDHPEMRWSQIAAERARRRTGVRLPEVGEYTLRERSRTVPTTTAAGAAEDDDCIVISHRAA